MKRIAIFLITIILIIVGTVLAIQVNKKMSRTCKIEEYNIKMNIPNEYTYVKEDGEGHLLSLYNSKNGISINAVEVKENFFASGDVESRMDQYLKLISAMNYDSSVKNPKKEVVERFEGKIGRAELELEGYENIGKTISIITSDEVGNVIIEITGMKEEFEKNIESIEKIIDSIKL